MKINDLKALFPQKAELIIKYENKIEHLITQQPVYPGFIKIFNLFIFLFSDDTNNTLIGIDNMDMRILLYSEAFKRIRSSSIIATKGYYVDALSILRSVFELNKGLNAIQNGVIKVQDYFGKMRNSSFRNLPDKEKEKLINEHVKDIDNKINNYDDRNIPSDLKDSLRAFKSIMHISVHKSFGNLVLNINKRDNLFLPDNRVLLFDLFVNNASFQMLMFLKNMIKSGFLLENNKEKIVSLAEFIEHAYLDMNEKYHSDIAKYIKRKY
ncbi:MAG: hypothetical protein NT009_12980 [Proteobacteria bacterium]|nr:hypothetical protein [Pseudomonadota bacterium]